MRAPEDRFAEKYVVVDSGCWIWVAGRNAKGYGIFRTTMAESMRLAHRFSYEQHVGTIPNGTELDHICRTPACVNWRHLEAVTHAVNVRRGNAVKSACSKCGGPLNLTTVPGARRCKPCRTAYNREFMRSVRAAKRRAL